MIFLQLILYVYCCIITYFIYVNDKNKKFPIKKIILFSLLFTIYNIIVTKIDGAIYVNADRNNYAYEFLGFRGTSTGLTWYFNFIKLFTYDFQIALYGITFICCFITFYSFFNDKNSNKYSLLFLLTTDFIIFTFFALKQCFTASIASLIFYIINNKEYKHKYLICALLTYLACAFHTTGYILIPILIMFYLRKNKKINIKISVILSCVFLLLFERLLTFITIAIPDSIIALKINEYILSNDQYVSSALSIIKGIPYYCIFILGISKKNKITVNPREYEKLLILSFIGAFFYFISFISYWMFRFTIIFYVPLSILFGIIIKNEPTAKKRLVYYILTILTNLIILIRWLYLVLIHGGF